MQELRLVLIVVGALAIGALLFHGLWTNKREGKSKFADKPLGKLRVDQETASLDEPEDDYLVESGEIKRKHRKEPDFSRDDRMPDPLIDDFPAMVPSGAEREESGFDAESSAVNLQEAQEEQDTLLETEATETSVATPQPDIAPMSAVAPDATLDSMTEPAQAEPNVSAEPEELEMQVLVLNVHAAANTSFIGTKLFDSMQQHGLSYGEMDIFHYRVEVSGTSKVLFSVANIMHPGTLAHSDPAQFSTQGISFFMTLPCYAEPDQNFNLMLKIAQQIADDLGGNVLDDQRNLMTPDRLAAYRRQIQEFTSAQID